jgi:acetyltransferase
VDVPALDALLVRFGQLVVEQAWIKRIEINPLLASPQLLALDVRIEVHRREMEESNLPRPAIRPYPTQYVSSWRMKDGQMVTFRPIRADDEPLMVKFHEGLSDESVYLRYFQGIGLRTRTSHERLTRICFIDYDREMALVGEQRDPNTDERRIIALGDLAKAYGRNEAEVATMVSDNYQGRGLGIEMMRRLIGIARDEKIVRVIATTLTENVGMSVIFKRLGFQTSTDFEEGVIEAEMRL